MDAYVAWLKEQARPLYEAGGTWWRPYHMALVQASARPEPVEVPVCEVQDALRKSGALFLRYFTRTSQKPTEFWYVACDEYKPEKLANQTRNRVRRGHESCLVQRVEPAWLAVHGYECYAAAFGRYRNAHPVSRRHFEQDLLACVGGPFDFWAVLCEGHVATYNKCVVGDDYVAAFVSKSHPAYLHFFPVYALQDTMLTTYVVTERKEVTYGFRSIVHDTNVQDFLEKFGCHKVYCDLKVVYRPPLCTLLSILLHFKPALDRLPDTSLTWRLKSLLHQEEIRRSFL